MESWMISLVIAVAGIVGSYAVGRYQLGDLLKRDDKKSTQIGELQKFQNENTPVLNHLSKVEEAFGKKIDDNRNSLTSLHQKVAQAPTMEEVRAEFVSKELFRQFEKHMDKRFDSLEVGQGKILEYIEKGGK